MSEGAPETCSGYPDPLGAPPPEDRFCDLVLTGGVASGVVYPWTVLELARHYRFRNLGGNSVGAMAAAIAAAAEYGRCTGHGAAFEPLRLMPERLAELDAAGRTKMLRLFQPAPDSRRLFAIFLVVIGLMTRLRHSRETGENEALRWPIRIAALLRGLGCLGPSPWLLWVLCMVWLLLLLRPWELALDGLQPVAFALAILALALGLALLAFGLALHQELRCGLAQNNWGLCRGKAVTSPRGATEPALVDWLHEAIQRSAGREPGDPPLTFADLWRAPRFGQPMAPQVDGYASPPAEPGIGLHMFSTNLSHGRPVRWPLHDPNTRLYFKRDEWQDIFPAAVLDPLWNASRPYAPGSKSDPDNDGDHGLREIPCGDLPIVVAARLSLSFPLLFSCVPVWAVHYERPREQRVLRPALLTDGGVCTNFPVHLFDAAHPRWPTFALLLDRRLKAYEKSPLFLPKGHLEGRADNWQDAVPAEERRVRGLFGLAAGLLQTSLDWNDRTAMRLPHVRNRVIRYALQDGEGQLYIDMSRQTMLKMAHEYGPRAARKLIEAFDTSAKESEAKPFWRQHLFVRAMSEYRALQLHLRSYAQAVHARRHSVPLQELLRQATGVSPLLTPEGQPDGQPLSPEHAEELIGLSRRIEELAEALERARPAIDAYEGKPVVELRLRVPI